jgi:TonB family protein
MKALAMWLLLLGSFLINCPAIAQTDTTSFVCYFPIEPMPELLTGGGTRGIVMAIQRRIIYPPVALQMEVEGRVFLAFTITPAGEIKQVTVVKSLWAPLDSAAVKAARQLPRFKPRSEKYGDMRYTVPVTFKIKYDRPKSGQRRRLAKKAIPNRNSTR